MMNSKTPKRLRKATEELEDMRTTFDYLKTYNEELGQLFGDKKFRVKNDFVKRLVGGLHLSFAIEFGEWLKEMTRNEGVLECAFRRSVTADDAENVPTYRREAWHRLFPNSDGTYFKPTDIDLGCLRGRVDTVARPIRKLRNCMAHILANNRFPELTYEDMHESLTGAEQLLTDVYLVVDDTCWKPSTVCDPGAVDGVVDLIACGSQVSPKLSYPGLRLELYRKACSAYVESDGTVNVVAALLGAGPIGKTEPKA